MLHIILQSILGHISFWLTVEGGTNLQFPLIRAIPF